MTKKSPSAPPDAGLRSLGHYQNRLPPWRYRIRQQLIPWVRRETPHLARLQRSMRSRALDSYFAITANLGTHTFFMIMLPILFWCGQTNLGRGMVHVLAGGVFLSGWIKDFLCLPRPLSPPLERITMSGSAALEYGCPSTHSTNAVSVALYAIIGLHSPTSTVPLQLRLVLKATAYLFAATIIVGRLYCGMHGFADVVAGSLLGAALTVVQCRYGEVADRFLYASDSYWAPLIVVTIVCFLVRTHPEPADDCPCFDDSVAFAGVIIGCEVGNWHYAKSGWAWNDPVPATVPFRMKEMGYAIVVLRILLGVLTIFLWREIMKPTLLRGLPPVFRQIEKLGLTLPRRFFLQPSEYKRVPSDVKDDNVIPSVSEFPSLFDAMRHPRRRAVSIGPQSAADAYETLAYRERRRRESQSKPRPMEDPPVPTSLPTAPDLLQPQPAMTASSSYSNLIGQGEAEDPPEANDKPEAEYHEGEEGSGRSDEREDREMFSRLARPRVRYDVEIVTKLVVYAGIGLLAVELNPILFEVVGLGIGGPW